MDDESIVIKLAEVKTSSGHRRVLLTREVIELVQNRGRGRVERAAKRCAICLMGMTGEDTDDLIPVARHDRFQRRRIAEDEHRVMMGRTRQAAGMVEHDQISSWSRRLQLVLQPSELRCAQ